MNAAKGQVNEDTGGCWLWFKVAGKDLGGREGRVCADPEGTGGGIGSQTWAGRGQTFQTGRHSTT